MSVENGEWVMHGTVREDPLCLLTPQQLQDLVKEKGFVPLFAGFCKGISVEERTLAADWWSDDPKRDPWMWRMQLSEVPDIAYGKFFGSKAGFVHKDWLQPFLNFRRDGYDFDARWEDGLVSLREKHIVNALEARGPMLSAELKRTAGFTKGGEKNFDSTIAQLQMKGYVVMAGFARRINRMGQPYGWHITRFATMEQAFGADFVAAAYGEEPKESRQRMVAHLLSVYPGMTEQQADGLLKG